MVLKNRKIRNRICHFIRKKIADALSSHFFLILFFFDCVFNILVYNFTINKLILLKYHRNIKCKKLVVLTIFVYFQFFHGSQDICTKLDHPFF